MNKKIKKAWAVVGEQGHLASHFPKEMHSRDILRIGKSEEFHPYAIYPTKREAIAASRMMEKVVAVYILEATPKKFIKIII